MDRQTDGWVDRQTDRQTDRQKDEWESTIQEREQLILEGGDGTWAAICPAVARGLQNDNYSNDSSYILIFFLFFLSLFWWKMY